MNEEQPNGDPAANQPDLAGYPSPEALAQGYRASSAEAQRLKQENSRFEQRVSALEAAIAQAANPQRGDPLAEYGIPPDLIDRRIEEKVERGIRQAFEPLARGFEARNKMLGTYGQDYNKFEADVAAFIGSDPELQQSYQRMFTADPLAAMDYAFLKFSDSQRKAHGAKGRSKETQGQMVEAQIPSARPGESRSQPPDNREGLKDAFKFYTETGNAEPYVKARLREGIPDSFLQQR